LGRISQWVCYGVALLLFQGQGGCTGEEKSQSAARQKQATSDSAPINAADRAIDSATIANGPLVVAFGDSLYAGYKLPSDEGLAPELQRVLRADGIAASVFNAGVSGDTTANGLARLAFVLDGLPRRPDLVIIGLGGNDLLRGIQPEQTRNNLDAILRLLQQRRIPAMLTGMVAPRNMGPEYVRDFDALYPDLAQIYDTPLHPFLLDGVITNPALLLDDGLHPNAAGVDKMARAIAPTVRKALAKDN
jgi:acyl-CoA thioesterase I